MKKIYIIAFFLLGFTQLEAQTPMFSQEFWTLWEELNPCPAGTTVATIDSTLVTGDTIWGVANDVFAHWYDCGELVSGYVSKDVLTTQNVLSKQVTCIKYVTDTFEVVKTLPAPPPEILEVEVEKLVYKDRKIYVSKKLPDSLSLTPSLFAGVNPDSNSPTQVLFGVGHYWELFTYKPIALEAGQYRYQQQLISYHAGIEVAGGIAEREQLVTCDTCFYWGKPKLWKPVARAEIAIGVSFWKSLAAIQVNPYLQLRATPLEIMDDQLPLDHPETHRAFDLHQARVRAGVNFRVADTGSSFLKRFEFGGYGQFDFVEMSPGAGGYLRFDLFGG